MHRTQISNLLPWFAVGGDKYLPAQSQIKDLLLARDPYQIYDYSATSITYADSNYVGSKDNNGLLIQRFHPYKLQWVDLVDLCRPHLPPDESIARKTKTISRRTIVEKEGVQWQITKYWDNAPVDPVEVSYEPFLGLPPAFLTNSSFPTQFYEGGVINWIKYIYQDGVQSYYDDNYLSNGNWQIVYPGKRFVYYQLQLISTPYEQVSDTTELLTSTYDATFSSWGIRDLLLRDYSDWSFFYSEQNRELFSFKSLFVPSATGKITLTYYVAVKGIEYWEQVYLDKHHQQIKLKAGEPIEIKLPYGIVAHSLSVTGSDGQLFTNNLIKNPAFTPNITTAKLFPPISPDTISALNQTRINILPAIPQLPPYSEGEGFSYRTINGYIRYVRTRTRNYYANLSEEAIPSFRQFKQRIYYANNNIWNQSSVSSFSDLNYEPALYMGDEAVINRFFSWVNNPLDLNYTMPTSPYYLESLRKIEQICQALEIERFTTYLNANGEEVPVVANLAHLIEKTASLLGYRPEIDGTYKPDLEKKRVRKVIPSTSKIDTTKLGVNNFGEEGIVLKRPNNRFKSKEIVSDEYVIVKDIPQLIAEFHDQSNLGLGIFESSAVQIKTDAGQARYNNQLEMLVDLVSTVKDLQEMIQSTLFSSLVTQGQTTEIIGGLGLPSLTKTLPIQIKGKSHQLPYKGISPHRSISQEVATCTYNVGIITGQLL